MGVGEYAETKTIQNSYYARAREPSKFRNGRIMSRLLALSGVDFPESSRAARRTAVASEASSARGGVYDGITAVGEAAAAEAAVEAAMETS